MTKLLCSAETKLALCLTASVPLGAVPDLTYGQDVIKRPSSH